MLEKDPLRRITIEELIEHPWMNADVKTLDLKKEL